MWGVVELWNTVIKVHVTTIFLLFVTRHNFNTVLYNNKIKILYYIHSHTKPNLNKKNQDLYYKCILTTYYYKHQKT